MAGDPLIAVEQSRPVPARSATALARLLRSPFGVTGLALIVLVVLGAIFADVVATHAPVGFFPDDARQGPSARHWFGTDQLGRDVFSRVLHGARSSLIVAGSVVVITMVTGIVLGGLAGFGGRAADAVLSRIIDVFLAFPFLVGALIVVVAVGGGRIPTIVAISVFSWASVARLFRGSVLSVRSSEFVEAARALGAGRVRIFLRHVVPNAIAPTLVFGAALAGTAIVAEAALSFLGLGVQEPEPSWGLMIAAGRPLLQSQPHIVVFPGLALFVTVLGFILLGDGLRDALDPRER